MNVVLIPVRAGSKSIPLKNIKEIAGKPLVYWTAKAANDCEDVDKVYIATDSPLIRDIVTGFAMKKVCVIGRNAEHATDTASTESVMLDFAEEYEFDNIALVQATSPLLTDEDLHCGFELFYKPETDSVLSVVRQKRFLWNELEDGYVSADNYDVFHRPRRQVFPGYFVENGAFYITSKKALLESRNRLSGNIRAYEMPEESYLEIDELCDWPIVEKILKNRNKGTDKGLCEFQADRSFAIPEIKMFLTDCDGVLTDGGMYYSENGDELKKFNAQDGRGFRLLREAGIVTGIITGENMNLNATRAKKLQVDIIEQNIENKLERIKELCEKMEIPLANVAFVGDDLGDLEVIKAVGFGCSVANGIDEIKRAAKYVSERKGGDGAVREVIDRLFKKQFKDKIIE